MRNSLFKIILLVSIICTGVHGYSQHAQKSWRPLFNGKDLTGWDSYLRPRDMMGYGDTVIPYNPIGLNKDPLHVFTVQNGLIHISGEVWGAITYKEVFGNYHLRFQVKWGEKKYAPKDTLARDGGLLFHCTDGFDYAFKCWMRSMEMQVQEGEIGDFFNVGAGIADFSVTPAVKTMYNEIADQYDPAKTPTPHPGRVYRSGNFEKPKGEWSTGELIARQADAVFIVNGFVVNRMYNIFRSDLMQQVTGGKIQFQSEGAEHYYRNIEIRPISFRQSHPKILSPTKEIVVRNDGQAEITLTNEGDAVEIIAAELIGKKIEQFVVKLPALPLLLKKGEKLVLPVSLKDGDTNANEVTFRLETVLGPIENFKLQLISK